MISSKDIRRYKKVRPLYEEYTLKVRTLLFKLLKAKKIDYVQIESRTKTVESFKGKMDREDRSYIDPVEEMIDLSGVRIIVYFNEDVDTVMDLINKEFVVDRERSSDRREIQEQDRFGYTSSHLIVTTHAKRLATEEWAEYADCRTEIQVRSILQHTWAAIDHKLRYKTTNAVPEHLKRKLFRLSALLELADEEFTTIKRVADTRIKKIQKEVKRGELMIKIDLDSLETYVKGSDTFNQFCKIMSESGFEISKVIKGRVIMSQLTAIAKARGIKYLGDIDSMILQELNGDRSKYIELGRKIAEDDTIRRKVLSRLSLLKLIFILNGDPKIGKSYLERYPFKKDINRVVDSYL